MNNFQLGLLLRIDSVARRWVTPNLEVGTDGFKVSKEEIIFGVFLLLLITKLWELSSVSVQD